MKVRIQSFGFKRNGYPKSKSGSGDGFVFDCRCIDAFDYPIIKPGRLISRKLPLWNLTGLDSQIVDVLDKDTDAQNFFRAVWFLVEFNILKGLQRDRKTLVVNFGCAAGQHRSVYMAEKLTQKIKQVFPDVEIEIVHLEKFLWPT